MLKKKKLILIFLPLVLLVCGSVIAFASPETTSTNLGKILPLWSCVPFVGMLLSIAIVPLIKPHWWEKNMLWVALFWSLLFLIPFGIAFGSGVLVYQVLEMILLDYLPFIVLLFGLFVTAGGIALKGNLVGTTKVNVVLLLIGTLLSSWVGTTGAAMLMIRPVIRANKWREKKAHIVVFFIFLVANIGGCLTPVGDPPLFLGFLRGVPFFWTMELVPMLLVNTAILLVVFALIDRYFYKKEIAAGRSSKDMQDNTTKEPLRIEGAHNLIFIAMIVFSVILNGILSDHPSFADQATGEAYGLNVFGVVFPFASIVQIAIILLAAVLSIITTKKRTREANNFSFGPIAEVAKLFIGIFLTMIPALAILKANGAALGLANPWQFFWATGALSSFLDNAPTYLVFMTTAGSLGATAGLSTTVGTITPHLLMAISAGAVFMGANTYIGNAPNFMVKSIAEENKIKMPSFFGYMGWSFAILIPLFLIDTLIFFL